MERIPRGRYTKEFRIEAVKLIIEENLSLPEAGRRLNMAPSTINNWVKAQKAGRLTDIGKSQRPLTDLEMELYRTKREPAEVKMERDILNKAVGVLCEGVAARYAMINELRLHYPVSFVKRVLSVSASGYYSWQDRPLSKRDREEMRLELEIKAAHRRTRQTYGPERLQHDLAENGVRVGSCRIKRIREKLGLRCKQKGKFKVTTDSRYRLPVTDNLLDQHFKVYEPNNYLSQSG